MLLYLYINLRLMNKLTSEMRNFFTYSNSHEFEEMVDPITCTPNEEPEENIVEIGEKFSEKESSLKFTKNSPAFLNAMYFPDFLHRMCTNWAIQARCLDLQHAKFGSTLLALHKMFIDDEMAYPVLANLILPAHSAPDDNTSIDDLLDV